MGFYSEMGYTKPYWKLLLLTMTQNILTMIQYDLLWANMTQNLVNHFTLTQSKYDYDYSEAAVQRCS